MADLYKKIMDELLDHNNSSPISDPITAPYDPLQDYQTQTAITHQFLRQSKRMRNRKAQLWYAYYLGEILENMPPEQRITCVKQLTPYYATVAVHAYYIFRI
ncbi:15377_t:CDS:1 [Cetraspora pellucida]|uniref:15377_t:CDS:1 n=1 Tax=Cetraspora pellucida TaxID=1433469 RepID=A0ACA9P0J4_9GLOM|nr:15377_t:CDS:1 [Cetraspora pellucida]